jgi:hypothetical protein
VFTSPVFTGACEIYYPPPILSFRFFVNDIFFRNQGTGGLELTGLFPSYFLNGNSFDISGFSPNI